MLTVRLGFIGKKMLLKEGKIFILGMKDECPEGAVEINTTSRSRNWSKGLSPFKCGPVYLYEGNTATNVENAWQFSKVYKHHIGEDGNPTEEYFKWAKKGWRDSYAHRYPMGKGAVPEYSWWDGQKLDYIAARKKIYIPLYANAVYKTLAYETLKGLVEDKCNIALRDFDGYDHMKLGMTLNDVVHDPTRKMGHAFVLAILLKMEIRN